MAVVLVVDDDDPFRDTIFLVLEDEGYACQQAANGEDALRLLRGSTGRLVVLLDLMMPRMTGKDVLNAVEADLSLAGQHALQADVLDGVQRRQSGPVDQSVVLAVNPCQRLEKGAQ